jgi:hypothetical protein
MHQNKKAELLSPEVLPFVKLSRIRLLASIPASTTESSFQRYRDNSAFSLTAFTMQAILEVLTPVHGGESVYD